MFEVEVKINAAEIVRALDQLNNTIIALFATAARDPAGTAQEITAGAKRDAAQAQETVPASASAKGTETAPDYKKLRADLRKELAGIARSGKTAELKELFSAYGVDKLSALPDEKLEAFRAEAGAL